MLSIKLFLAIVAGLHLCYTHAIHHRSIAETSFSLRFPSSITNNCIRHAQVLYSTRLHDIYLVSRTSSFDEGKDAAMIELSNTLRDSRSLNTSVYLSACGPIFHSSRAHDFHGNMLLEMSSRRRNDQDHGLLEASIASFYKYAAARTIDRCDRSIELMIKQLAYLQRLYEALSAYSEEELLELDLFKQQRIYLEDYGFDVRIGLPVLLAQLET